jgi:hypothetical protein
LEPRELLPEDKVCRSAARHPEILTILT